MTELLIGDDTAVITLLLLFITGLLTKRFVPWWVHEEVLKKLATYENTAPELIGEVKRLMAMLDATGNRKPHRVRRANARVRKRKKLHANQVP